MKIIVLTVAIILCSGCAVQPSAFSDRCTLEGHGPASGRYDLCKNYYARIYTAQRKAAFAGALSREADRSAQRNRTVQCDTFGTTTTCREF